MKNARLIAATVLSALLCSHSFGQSDGNQSVMADQSIRELESVAAARFLNRAPSQVQRPTKKTRFLNVAASILRSASANTSHYATFFQAAPNYSPLFAAKPDAGTPYSHSATQFQRVRSVDGIISMDLPADWRIGSPAADNFAAFSPRGETFSCGRIDVFLDRSGAAAAAQALQMMGATRQQLAMLPRLVSPPLSPTAVVQQFLPEISAGVIDNPQVVAARPLGQSGAELVYRYVLLPGRDSLFRSMINPTLRNYGQVPMQARARIYTAPGVFVGTARTWTLLYEIVDAPQPVFATSGTNYERIFQSFAIDNNALQRQAAVSQQQASAISSSIVAQNQMIQQWSHNSMQKQYEQLQDMQEWNTRIGQKWIDMAGEQSRYVDPNDPNWEGTTSWGDIPNNSTPYRCPLENAPVHVPSNSPPPSSGCSKLQPYEVH
jgi:hypothetical protein